MDDDIVVGLLVGLLQGLFEWLPISSEGNVTVVLTALDYDPGVAVDLSLFVHVGTALAATVYYRRDLRSVVRALPEVRPRRPFDGDGATLSFLVVGTLVSGVVGAGVYATLSAVVSSLTGGAVIAAIGALLVATGLVERVAGTLSSGTRSEPTATDAVLVGALQGLALLPGVSRSGTTVSGLLLRGYDSETAFDLSFLLSIPAAFGAGGLALLDTGGLPGVSPEAALAALAVAAVVGYATIGALLRVVRRVEFWVVCVGLGGVMVAGSALVLVL